MALEDLCDVQYEAVAYWLNRLDERWQDFNLNELTEAETHGLFTLVNAGCVQKRMRVTFWLKSLADGSTFRTERAEVRISGWWMPDDLLEAAKPVFGVAHLGHEWTGQLDFSAPAGLRIRAEWKRRHAEWRQSGNEKRELLIHDLRNIAADRRENHIRPEISLRFITDDSGKTPTVVDAPAPPRIMARDNPYDSFRHFVFTEPDEYRGWGCGIKADTPPWTALAAATDIAGQALFLIGLKRDQETCEEQDEWFHKADIVLHTVTTDLKIKPSLVQARIREADSAGEVARIDFLGINGACWHEWTRTTLSHFVCHGTLQSDQSIEGIVSRLQIESVRAQDILKAQTVAVPMIDTSTWSIMSPGQLESLTGFKADVVRKMLREQRIPNDSILKEDGTPHTKQYRVHPEFIANTKSLRAKLP